MTINARDVYSFLPNPASGRLTTPPLLYVTDFALHVATLAYLSHLDGV